MANTVNGWSYQQNGSAVIATDPQGNRHNFANWSDFWQATGGKSAASTNVTILMVLFWLHNGLFFLMSLGPVMSLITVGKTEGQLNLMPLLLAWIAGTLMWGLGAMIMRR